MIAISLNPAPATRSTSLTTLVDRQAAAGAAGRRDDAVAAALLAAGLHPQRERGPPGDARLDRRAAGAIAVAEPVRGRQSRHGSTQIGQLVVVADDADDFGSARELVGPRVA